MKVYRREVMDDKGLVCDRLKAYHVVAGLTAYVRACCVAGVLALPSMIVVCDSVRVCLCLCVSVCACAHQCSRRLLAGDVPVLLRHQVSHGVGA
jgi:hypothetical protein